MCVLLAAHTRESVSHPTASLAPSITRLTCALGSRMPSDSEADAKASPRTGEAQDSDGRIRANPGYALGQLARALAASQAHEDPELRERARERAQVWSQVFEG